jgi:hypothetical protein
VTRGRTINFLGILSWCGRILFTSNHSLLLTLTRTVPSDTCPPSCALSSVTVPSNGATRLCSIFMASSVTSLSPLVTVSPTATLTASLQIAGQVIVLQQDAVLERLVPTLDLPLRLRMEGRAANVAHVPIFEPVGQLASNIAGTVVGQ